MVAASVMLLKADTAVLVKASTTDKEGKFQFDHIKDGAYMVSVSAIGFKKNVSERIELNSQRAVARVADIRLMRDDATTLKEATVTAKRPFMEQKIDRTVFNIEQLLSVAGSNTLDILDKLPGVEVDIDGQIQLLGKQNVIVLMDDKVLYMSGDQLAGFLKAIPANSIERIETMYNPPAKYDASGTAGIINIIRKRVRDKGFNGNFSTSYSQGIYAAQDNTLNLSYHTDKIGLNVLLSSQIQNLYRNSDYSQYNLNPDGTLNSQLLSSTYIKTPITGGNGRAEFDYFIDKKTTLAFIASGVFAKFNSPTTAISRVMDASNTVDSIATTDIETRNHANTEGFHLNFDHQYKSPGKELTGSLDYVGNNFHSNQIINVYNYQPDGALKDPPTYLTDSLPFTVRVYSEQIDYTCPLRGKASIQFGEKSSYVSTDNNGLYYDVINNVAYPDLTKSNEFLYKENINATYVSFNEDFKRISIKGGLRAENTNITGNQLGNAAVPDLNFKQKYIDVFPTAYFLYKFDSVAKNQIVLSYGRRIDRPFFLQLNPFPNYINKYSYYGGNPYLQPDFANIVSLAHTYKRFLTTTLSFSYTSGISARTYEQTDSLVVIQKPVNIGSLYAYSISVTASLHPAKWWNCTLFSLFIYNHYNGAADNFNLNSSLGTFQVSATNQFQLKRGWSAELTGFYKTKTLNGVTETDPLWRADGAIRKSILKGKGNLTLNFRDIFLSFQTNGRILNLNLAYAVTHDVIDSRAIRFTFAYEFGKRYALKPKATSSFDQEMRMGQK